MFRQQATALIAAIALSGPVAAQTFNPISIDASKNPAAGQPRCANMANREGAKAYEIFTNTKMSAAEYKSMYISPPSAYVLGAKKAPQLLAIHADFVWGGTYKKMQAAVDDFYVLCMESDVARDSDRLVARP